MLRASPFVLGAAMVLLGRLPAWASPFALGVSSLELVFSMAYALAFKFCEDAYVTSRDLAAVAGLVDVGRWNRLEVAFLEAIRYDCGVSMNDVWAAEPALVDEALQSCLAADLYPELEAARMVPPSGLVRPCAPWATVSPSLASMDSDDVGRADAVPCLDGVAYGADFVESDFESASGMSLAAHNFEECAAATFPLEPPGFASRLPLEPPGFPSKRLLPVKLAPPSPPPPPSGWLMGVGGRMEPPGFPPKTVPCQRLPFPCAGVVAVATGYGPPGMRLSNGEDIRLHWHSLYYEMLDASMEYRYGSSIDGDIACTEEVEMDDGEKVAWL
jgi:hypothetical protein